MLLRFTRNQYIWCFLIESYSKLVWFTMTKRWHKKFLNVAFDWTRKTLPMCFTIWITSRWRESRQLSESKILLNITKYDYLSYLSNHLM